MVQIPAEVCVDCDSHPDLISQVRSQLHDSETHARLAEFFKTMADPTRVKLLDALSRSELCVQDLAVLLDMSQSAVSHQLRVLRQNHFVKFHKEGKHVFYQLDDEHVSIMLKTGMAHIRHEI